MRRAAGIVLWHLIESRRFFGEIALPDSIARMVRLDEWLIRQCKVNQTTAVPTREAQQFGPLRTKVELDAALQGLQELDRVRVKADGKLRTIELNPMLLQM